MRDPAEEPIITHSQIGLRADPENSSAGGETRVERWTDHDEPEQNEACPNY